MITLKYQIFKQKYNAISTLTAGNSKLDTNSKQLPTYQTIPIQTFQKKFLTKIQSHKSKSFLSFF